MALGATAKTLQKRYVRVALVRVTEGRVMMRNREGVTRGRSRLNGVHSAFVKQGKNRGHARCSMKPSRRLVRSQRDLVCTPNGHLRLRLTMTMTMTMAIAQVAVDQRTRGRVVRKRAGGPPKTASDLGVSSEVFTFGVEQVLLKVISGSLAP